MAVIMTAEYGDSPIFMVNIVYILSEQQRKITPEIYLYPRRLDFQQHVGRKVYPFDN
jgi:hypothetical protein